MLKTVINHEILKPQELHTFIPLVSLIDHSLSFSGFGAPGNHVNSVRFHCPKLTANKHIGVETLLGLLKLNITNIIRVEY